jgi:uncharacterized membrane protein YhaH (DUF805 family)
MFPGKERSAADAVRTLLSAGARGTPALDNARPLDYRHAMAGVKKFFKNFFSYKGRIGRLNFYISFLLVDFVFLILTLAPSIHPFWVWGDIVIFFALLSFPAVKRSHDLDEPGAYFFHLLIPIWNFYFFARFLCERGTIGPNQYGEDPVSEEDQG